MKLFSHLFRLGCLAAGVAALRGADAPLRDLQPSLPLAARIELIEQFVDLVAATTRATIRDP